MTNDSNHDHDQLNKKIQDSSSRQGKGSIVLSLNHGHLHLSELTFTYPLKLVAPRPTTCQSVFLLSYGGGLVGGDSIELQVLLGPKTVLALLTQGSTKIFKDRGSATRQSLKVHIRQGATCILVPDPVQPFADSNYIQHQSFHVEESNLILLDWVVSGRPASGECWAMRSYESVNSIYGPKLLLRDSQTLGLQTKPQMQNYNCIATLMFTGPALLGSSALLLKQFKQSPRILSRKNKIQELIHTITCHREITVIKVAGSTSEDVKNFLSQLVDTCGWRDIYGPEAFRALD